MFDFVVSLPSDARAPGAARRALEGVRPRLDRRAFDQTVLLVSELVTNSVRHASLSNGDAIGVRVRIDGSRIRVDVTDPGPGFDPAARRPAGDLESGWGLTLLKKLAARWGVRRNHDTTVWFEIRNGVPS